MRGHPLSLTKLRIFFRIYRTVNDYFEKGFLNHECERDF